MPRIKPSPVEASLLQVTETKAGPGAGLLRKDDVTYSGRFQGFDVNVKVEGRVNSSCKAEIYGETYFGVKKRAWLRGTIGPGDKAELVHVHEVRQNPSFTADGLLKADSVSDRRRDLEAVGALLLFSEEALRRSGLNEVSIVTHSAFARFLEEMGWVEVSGGGDKVHLKKDLGAGSLTLPKVLTLRGTKPRETDGR